MWHDSWYGEWYGEWFGTQDASGAITLEGFANSNSLGTLELRATIELAGFANAQSFGVPQFVAPPTIQVIGPVGGWPQQPRRVLPHLIMPEGIDSTCTVGVPTVVTTNRRRLAQRNSEALFLLAA